MKWFMEMPGWYILQDAKGKPLAGVYNEGAPYGWCVYITNDMPPGDSQHKTLKAAQIEALRRLNIGGSNGPGRTSR